MTSISDGERTSIYSIIRIKLTLRQPNNLKPAGASASADVTLNWITPQHAGLALQALIDYKELIDFIPRI